MAGSPWLLLLLFFLLSCSGENQHLQDEKLLAQANSYHLQAIEKNSQLQARLLQLDGQLTSLQEGATRKFYSQLLDSCRLELRELEQNISEVPGFAHTHDAHDHHHHHHHGPVPELSPQQHLAVQQAYLQAVEKIYFTTDSLASAIQKFTLTQE